VTLWEADPASVFQQRIT